MGSKLAFERAYAKAEVSEALEYCAQLENVYFMVTAREQYVIDIGENNDVLLLSVWQLYFDVMAVHTLSGRTGSALVWHSEGRTIEALSVQ